MTAKQPPALPPGTPPLLTLAEVARLCRRHPNTVGRWVDDEKVTTVTLPGGIRLYPAAQFAELLAVTGWPV